MKTAGSRRNRKNAVELNVPDYGDGGQVGRGRPSKGGQAVRAHRYYAKNHMLVLQKRKLKRYIVKVKHFLQEHDYDPEAIYNELMSLVQRAMKTKIAFSENELLAYANSVRDDRYLQFLNEEGDEFINSLFQDNPDEYPSPEKLEIISNNLRENHTTLAFKLCTLLSAYLLICYITQKIDYENVQEVGILQQKYMQNCSDLYKPNYTHLTGEEETVRTEPSEQALQSEERQGKISVSSVLNNKDT